MKTIDFLFVAIVLLPAGGQVFAFSALPEVSKREQVIAQLTQQGGRDREVAMLNALEGRAGLCANIGGELEQGHIDKRMGEWRFEDCLNVNPMMGSKASAETIWARKPFDAGKASGGLLQFGAEDLPFDDQTVALYVAVKLPSVVLGTMTAALVSELKRVLMPEGLAIITCNSPVFTDETKSGREFREAGFVLDTPYKASYRAPRSPE